MATIIGPVQKCQVCGSTRLSPVLDLGHHPIVQNYLDAKALQAPETTYPLRLTRCDDCALVQLDYVVDPAAVFPPSYPYRTGLTNMLLRNFEALAEEMLANNFFSKGNLVVDIGSNDGSLLQSFKKRGAHVVGVEPTDAAKVANKVGIKTYQEFFDIASAARLAKRHGKARVVTATNVFAHIPDTPKLLRAVKSLLASDGVFVSESQYLGDIVEKLEFDTIYHEHLRFYSLRPLLRLAKDAGMSIVDAHRISAAGGSIRVYMKKGAHEASARTRKLMQQEEASHLNEKETIETFAHDVVRTKNDLLTLLFSIRKKGANIVAISSPARSNTLLNFCHLTPDIIEYAGEKKGSPKIGLFAPGSHIPVVDELRIFKEQSTYALVLSWHIGEELMKIYRKLGYKGAFIMPLPTPRILK